MVHVTKNGERIELKDLETSHLKNIISWIERKAKTGIVVMYGGGEWDIDDIWYYEEILKGEEVLTYMHHAEYVAELSRRINK